MSKKRGKSKKKKRAKQPKSSTTSTSQETTDTLPDESPVDESPAAENDEEPEAASAQDDADAVSGTSTKNKKSTVAADRHGQDPELSEKVDEARAPKLDATVASKPKGKEPWNPLAVGFNGIGVLVAVVLFVLGSQKTYQVFDMLWLHHLGDTYGYVVDVDTKKDPKGKTIYLTTVELVKMGRFPKARVKVADKRLYDYVRYRYHPPRQLRLSVVRVQRKLSGQAAIARAGPLRLIRAPKSADLILGLGLAILGLALCFTSVRDLRKRWLRRGLPG